MKEKISETEKFILEILEKTEKLQFSELYKKYCEKVEKPLSKRMFRNYVNHLAKIRLIKINKKILGNVIIVSKA
jgi:UDP-galactopyranose mutase